MVHHFSERFSAYQIMWVLVFFDLPTETKQDKQRYIKFRKTLLQDGFTQFQFSIYLRHCMSREAAQVHINRVKRALPKEGNIGILAITDKQFGDMELFEGQAEAPLPVEGQQLMLF